MRGPSDRTIPLPSPDRVLRYSANTETRHTPAARFLAIRAIRARVSAPISGRASFPPFPPFAIPLAMLSCLPPPTLYTRSTRAAVCRALRQASAADSALKLAIKFDPFREPWSNSLPLPFRWTKARFHLPYLPASSVLQVWNILGPHVETISRRSIFQRGNLTGNPLSPVPQVPNLLVDPSIAPSNSANVCASRRPPSTGQARTMKFLAQTIIAVDKFIPPEQGGRG